MNTRAQLFSGNQTNGYDMASKTLRGTWSLKGFG